MSPAVREHEMSGLESAYRSKKVLITGGLGFIGSNLAMRLVHIGADVTVVDCELEGGGANEFNISPVSKNLKIFRHDIADKAEIEPLIENVDFVFNLSGYNNHLDSMVHPEKIFTLTASASLDFCVRVLKKGSKQL